MHAARIVNAGAFRAILALAAVLLAASASPAAQEAEQAALLKLNADYIRAYRSSDSAGFEALLADPFVCELADGSVLDRAGFLAMARVPPRISDLQNSDLAVRVAPGGAGAALEGLVRYRRSDGTPARTRYLCLCAKTGKGWRIVSVRFERISAAGR